MTRNSRRRVGIKGLVHQQSNLDQISGRSSLLIAGGDGFSVFDTESRSCIEAMSGL